MKKEKHKRLQKKIAECYEEMFYRCKKRFNGSERIYGTPIKDIYHAAIQKLLKWYSERGGPDMEKKLTKPYIKEALFTNFKQEVSRISDKKDISDKYKNDIEPHGELSDDIEQREYEEIINHFGEKVKALIKMRVRDEMSIREVCDRLDIPSMRQYYKIRENIKTRLESYGVESNGTS